MNNTDNMKSFLFYDYFKVSVDDYYKFELEKKIKICANRAYLDFCRTIAYDHIEKETEQKYSEKNWEILVASLKTLFYEGNKTKYPEYKGLIEEIKQLIDPKNATSFGNKHKKLCTDLTNIKDPILKKNLSIGQAQKWINMTLKYLWLTDCLETQIIPYLHVPIDNYILKELLKETENKPIKSEHFEIKKENGQYLINGNTWSKIDKYDTYKEIQKYINNILKDSNQNPIEWEYDAWLAAQNKD